MSIIVSVHNMAHDASAEILGSAPTPVFAEERDAFAARLRSQLESLARRAYMKGRKDARASGILTARDKFAMHALGALASAMAVDPWPKDPATGEPITLPVRHAAVAGVCVDMADALLERLNRLEDEEEA